MHQVSHLVNEGYKEIVITGVDITAYGKRLCLGEPSLGKLCQQILKHVPELKAFADFID